MTDPSARRPLKSRSTGWARSLASLCVRAGFTPNGISAASVGFAAAGAAGFLAAGQADVHSIWRWAGLLAAAAGIQLRLVCNLIDGMVAIEGGRKSLTGDLWNEIPDRYADVVLLTAAGFASGAPWAGAAASAAALLTAYVRALGASLTQKQDFCGPMAKPHRMAALTFASLIALAAPLWSGDGMAVLRIGLWIIAGGTLLTVFRRQFRVAAVLRKMPRPPES